MTVAFPWGSLLRGVVGLDQVALGGAAALVASGGGFDVLASVVPSDRIDGIASLDASREPEIRRAWAAVGLQLVSMRLASTAESAASGSSWARRLAATRDTRPVWRLEGCRP